MTSPLPPKRRDSRNLADLVRQDRVRLGQLDRGLVGGRFPPARPLKPAFGDDAEDDFNDPAILFANTDHAACSSDGAAISIPLSHVPEPGSEQVYYNGTPLKWSDWSRTDTVLTIPGEPWFRAGKVAWVDYAYYDDDGGGESDPAVFVSDSYVVGDHTSIPSPAGGMAGDMLVLVLSATNQVGCSDPRFTLKNSGTRPTWAGPLMGVWVGTDDGSGSPISVLMDSVSGSGGADSVGAVMRIRGNPLLPATAEATSSYTATGGPSTFSPTIPTGGSFGVMAISSEVGLVTSGINGDELGNWTLRRMVSGGGGGHTSIWLGTTDGPPAAGRWSQAGSDPLFVAWCGGLQ